MNKKKGRQMNIIVRTHLLDPSFDFFFYCSLVVGVSLMRTTTQQNIYKCTCKQYFCMIMPIKCSNYANAKTAYNNFLRFFSTSVIRARRSFSFYFYLSIYLRTLFHGFIIFLLQQFGLCMCCTIYCRSTYIFCFIHIL